MAASLRRGGVDRIVVPEPWTRSIEQLVADGVRGELYSHELVTLPPGTAPDFLAAFGAEGIAAHEALGLELVGAFRVAMVNGSEAIVIWAIPDWPTWALVERAWLGEGTGDREALHTWRRKTLAMGAGWRRTLMLDAPLGPLRIGRQPDASDRRPLDEI